MGIFQYGENNGKTPENGAEKNDGPNIMTICDSGSGKYTTLRMTVPSDIADEHQITPGDQIKVEETENGFEAEVLDV